MKLIKGLGLWRVETATGRPTGSGWMSICTDRQPGSEHNPEVTAETHLEIQAPGGGDQEGDPDSRMTRASSVNARPCNTQLWNSVSA